jgi:hypothetical protein
VELENNRKEQTLMANTVKMTPTETLWGAVSHVQAQIPVVERDATNPHFRSSYTTLAALHKTVVPLLAQCGLAWVCLPSQRDGAPVLRYRLVYVPNGEALEGEMPLLVGNGATPQQLGSALTYARRYALAAVLGIASAEEDDDGQAASQRAPGQATRPAAPRVQAQASGGSAVISQKQRGLLNARAREAGLTARGFARLLLDSAGHPGHEVPTDEERAREYVDRLLDRYPRSAVDAALEAIAALGTPVEVEEAVVEHFGDEAELEF